MKRGILVLLCVLLPLSGCSTLLNREYASSTPHVEYPVSDKSAVLQAENHQGLVNAILYFITEHKETGIVHLSYAKDDERVVKELDAACQEVRTEDPLGAYAVENIEYASQLIKSYYEVTVTISYAHTVEELSAIVPVAGSSAIRQTISAAMTTFADKCVFRISYFTGNAGALRQLVRQTWLDTPLAMVQPAAEITLYPDSGTSRIVEITLQWPVETESLAEQRALLEQRALTLLERLDLSREELTPEALLTALKRMTIYEPQGSTAYSVLVEGRGNTLGYAQALRLLCQLADLEATVVEGALRDEVRYWLIVNTPEGYRHLDPVMSQPVYATDEEFTQAGYIWSLERYPACTSYTAPAEPDPDASESPQEDGEEPQGDSRTEDED